MKQAIFKFGVLGLIMIGRARLVRSLIKFDGYSRRNYGVGKSLLESFRARNQFQHAFPGKNGGNDKRMLIMGLESLVGQRRSIFSLFMSSVDEDEATDTSKSVDSLWNIPGLKKEVQRLVLRGHKKLGKANQRLKKAQETVEELNTNPDVTLEELEQCPNIEALQLELQELQDRLQGLNQLESALAGIKGKSAVALPPDVALLAIDLGVDDQPPQRPERGPPKPKGPRSQNSARLPYRRYYSVNNIEIRVGKQAEDNDQLSLSPQHRDSTDWWMHASGCPGSHVVIRCGDPSLPEELVMDAAALAARQSKCHGKNIKVSLTRCRDVIKPPGAKAGLVQLVGNVRTITVNMKEAQVRLDRLDKTVLVN